MKGQRNSRIGRLVTVLNGTHDLLLFSVETEQSCEVGAIPDRSGKFGLRKN